MKLSHFTLLTLFVLWSCGGATNNSEQNSTADAENDTEQADGDREPTDDEIREYGLLTKIEDGGYPMFSIDVEFPERQMTRSFRFNVEESALNTEQLTAMEGKYATIYYITEDDPLVESIVKDCEPVWGEISPDSNGIQEITGILSGATATSGDLPGMITVTASDGTVVSFELFIEEEMLSVNDEEVTVFYYESSSHTITYLKASED